MAQTAKKNTLKQPINSGGFIDRSNPNHIAYLNEQKRIFSSASDYFVSEANETERALCAQLMLVDTVLLTGTLVAIANKDLAKLLSDTVSVFIFIAFCLLLFSVAFGIKYYFEIVGYNKRWAIAKHNSMKTFLDVNIESWEQLRKKTDSYQIEIPQELNGPWLKLQILFIGVAALLYSAALFGLMFNVGELLSSINYIPHC